MMVYINSSICTFYWTIKYENPSIFLKGMMGIKPICKTCIERVWWNNVIKKGLGAKSEP